MSEMQRARSVHEVMGLPPLPGLPPLDAREARPVPYADLREELSQLLQKNTEERISTLIPTDKQPVLKPASYADFIVLMDKLEAAIPDKELHAFQQERELVNQVIAGENLQDAPNLDTAERQMLWSAAIGHLYFTGQINDNFSKDSVVRAVIESEYVDTMLMDFAMHTAIDATLVLGAPGSWFYCSMENKLINLDLCQSLAIGGAYNQQDKRINAYFTSLFNHEYGHALLSGKYPESMQKLWEEMYALADKGGMKLPDITGSNVSPKHKDYTPGEGVSIDEYKRFLALNAEWGLRHRFWNAAEDNCVNRYNCNLADPKVVRENAWRHPDHLADSLNVAISIANNVGSNARKHAAGKLRSSDNSAEMQLEILAHAVNMSFFIRNHLAPDTLEGWQSLNMDASRLTGGEQALERIKELTQRIELCQPMPYDEALGRNPLRQRKQAFEQQHEWARTIPKDDGITGYDDWVAYHNQQRNQQIEILFREFATPLIAQIMEEKTRKINDEVDQLQHNPPQQSSSEGGMRIKGLPGTQSAPGIPGQNPAQGMEEAQKKNRGGDSDKETKRKQEQTETTEEMKRRKLDGNGRQQRPKTRQNAPPQSAPSNPLKAGQNQAGRMSGNQSSPFDNLQFGDGRKYNELTEDPAFQIAVSEGARQLQLIARRVRQYEPRTHEQQYELPDSTEAMERLDSERVAHLDTAIRNPRELNLGVDDFNIAHTQYQRPIPTKGDIVVLIDGSGSMGNGQGSMMEIAMKTAALIEQFGSRADYRVVITLWGDEQPFLVVEPGMDQETIAQNIDGIIEGKQCGTQLAPSLPDALDRLLAQRYRSKIKHGFTHFIVVTDGATHDDHLSIPMLQTIMDRVPNSTLDVAVTKFNPMDISGIEFNNLEQGFAESIRSLQFQQPHQKPGVTLLSSKHDAPKEMIELLDDRVKLCSRKVKALDSEQYRRKIYEARQRINNLTDDDTPETTFSRNF